MAIVAGTDRKQYVIICPDEAVAEDNPVRVIDALIESFDLVKLGFAPPNHRGRSSYAASDMLKLYLYGYCHGIRSSRKLEAETHRNIEVRWLLRNLTPDFKTIAEFRRKNPRAFQNVFRQFVLLLDGSGLLGKEIFAVDGTKFRASNNKKMNLSQKKITDRIARIDEKLKAFNAEMDTNDKTEESATVDMGVIEQLKARKAEFQAHLEALVASGENEMSLVDPDARLMGNNRGGVDVSYNVQSAVDDKHCLVVAVNVTNNPADNGQLSIMGKQIRKQLRIKGKFIVLADKGYYSGKDLHRCKKNKFVTYVAKQKTGRNVPDPSYIIDNFTYQEGTDCFICPQGTTLHRTGQKNKRTYENKKACKACEHRAKCTKGEYRRLWVSRYQKACREVDERVAANPALYKKRQMIVEHPIGTIKRSMNGYYFLLRTLKKVRGEVALLFLAYNFKRALNILGTGGLRQVLPAFSSFLFSFLVKRTLKAPARTVSIA